MSAVTHQIEPRCAAPRSSITTGSWLLDGVDNRTTLGRRYRDLCMSFADDLGGTDKLTASQETIIRQASAAIVESEKLQAQIVRGEEVNHEQVVRLMNLADRLVRRLGMKTNHAGQTQRGDRLRARLASRATA